MKYAVDMCSDAMIYIPSFIKIGSDIEILMGRHKAHTQTARRSQELTLLF
jgi:hypothetical protein